MRSLPRLSGHGSHENRRPHVLRGGCRLSRVKYHEPVLVSVPVHFSHLPIDPHDQARVVAKGWLGIIEGRLCKPFIFGPRTF